MVNLVIGWSEESGMLIETNKPYDPANETRPPIPPTILREMAGAGGSQRNPAGKHENILALH